MTTTPGIARWPPENACNLCTQLAELDTDIVRAYDLFRELAQKRRIMKEQINRCHDPLIQHLPYEIVSQIFTRCVEDCDPRFLEQEDPIFSKAECSAPLIISAVCKSWREIAFATPRLWTTANIYLYSPHHIKLQEELARQWLARSGQHPLTISIYQLEPVDLEEVNLDAVSVSPLFDAVRDYAHRWQQLALRIPSSCHTTFIGDLKCALSLENLQIFSWLDDGRQVFNLSETPVLRELRINNIYLTLVNVQWANLTVFEMKNLNADEIFEVLRRAGRLETCIFTEVRQQMGVYPFPMTPVTHLLKHLELRPINEDDANLHDFRIVLDCLVLPCLDHFVYDTSESNTVPVDSLVSLFTRSQCAIKTFKIQGPNYYIADHKLIRILEHLPSLKRLSLNSTEIYGLPTWITDRLFERLRIGIRASATGTYFLPHLEDLEISSESPRAFSWGCFITSMNCLRLHISRPHLNIDHRAHVLSNTTTQSTLLPAPESQRSHVNVTVQLNRNQFDAIDYIDPNAVLHLANSDWEHGVSLRILDKRDGIDLIQTSLLRLHIEKNKNIDEAVIIN